MDLMKDETPIRAIYRSEKSLKKVKRAFELYNIDWEDASQKIEWTKSDLLNPDTLSEVFQSVVTVFHCAAMVSFNKRDKETLFKVNIEGTANVVNLCLEKGVKKLCHVSSTAAIGKSPQTGIRNEECTWQNDGSLSHYSISKYFSELEVWRGSEEGLDVVIVNPSIIIGAGDWTKSSSNLFLKIWKGLKFYSLGINAFVDVRDVSRAMVQLMKSPIKNKRFLVVSENLTFQHVFNLIATSLKKSNPSILVKPWMAKLIWRVEAVKTFLFGTDPLVTKESAKSALDEVCYSNEKLKKELDFEFYSIQESVLHTSKLFLRDHSSGSE
jgi:nucleoside-diphosphate-sugar epimerase